MVTRLREKMNRRTLRYFDVPRHWTKKIVPLLTQNPIRDVLVRDLNKFTVGKCGQRFTEDRVPADFETCLWDVGHNGPRPRYWDYVRHGACHWVVNFNLKLAEAVAPSRRWRILTSDLHSTVFDGTDTLFDMNYMALGVTPADSYHLATDGTANAEELPPGQEMKVPWFLPTTPEAAKLALEEVAKYGY